MIFYDIMRPCPAQSIRRCQIDQTDCRGPRCNTGAHAANAVVNNHAFGDVDTDFSAASK